MADKAFRLRRQLRAAHRRVRELRMIGRALASTKHPVMAHLIPIRRCNLSCAYCNEYDDYSKPLPVEVMKRRIDHLADLGTTIVTLSGGEPLLHPDLEQVIAHIRERGVIACMITNGYLLTADRIKKLNESGLDHMQISIDNVKPDAVSMKSLKTLDKKLQLLAEHAIFHVNINSVIGAGTANPEDAVTVGKRAIELGFTSTMGIIHDGDGQLRPLGEREQAVYQQMKTMRKTNFSRFNQFQEYIAQGKANDWKCRAGARYLYICEEGLVHYCSQQRGFPGTPLEQYTKADLAREYNTEKGCAPYCTVSCVHQVSLLDGWRDPQTLRPTTELQPATRSDLVQIETR